VSQLAHLAFEEQGRVMVARVAGEVDLSNAGDLQRSMLDAVLNTAEGMVIDLSVVSYLDSSGIRMLGEIGERLRWREQRFAVVAPPGSRVRGVLAIAGAEGVVPLEDALDAALERVREPIDG
jgi:anti-sigma B factor antagonist